jgi:hypothetical protein
VCEVGLQEVIAICWMVTCYAFARRSRTCTVAAKDIRDLDHSIEVTAATLYEAIRRRSCGIAEGHLGWRDRSGIHNGDYCCPAAARKARSQNEGLCLVARTPRPLSLRGHTEAKAREDIGQGKPREDLTEQAKQTNRQQ